MHWLLQDIRHALRGFRRQPSFAFLAVLALALGIGAPTNIFNPFPYTNAERIVNFYIHDTSSSRPGKPAPFEKANLHTWLAWQDEPGYPPGTALTRQLLDPHKETAAPFVKWFRNLFES